MGWLDSLPVDGQSQITLVHKHFPLPQHKWSRAAAIYASCSEKISDSMFWRISRQIFAMQERITQESLESEVFKTLKPEEEADKATLKSCVANGDASGTVDRDIRMAQQLGVHSTPSVFFNGHRVHIGSYEQLADTIRRMSNQDKGMQSASSKDERRVK